MLLRSFIETRLIRHGIRWSYGNYVVVKLIVGGTHAKNITSILQRELRTSNPWLSTSDVLPNEERFDATVRKLLEEPALL
jgi:hypothetical protein